MNIEQTLNSIDDTLKNILVVLRYPDYTAQKEQRLELNLEPVDEPQQATAPVQKQPSLDDLVAAAVAYSDSHTQDNLLTLLRVYNPDAEKLSDVAEEDRKSLLQELTL